MKKIFLILFIITFSFIGFAQKRQSNTPYQSITSDSLNIKAKANLTGSVGINQINNTYSFEVGGGTLATNAIRTWTGIDFYQVPDPTSLSGALAAGTELGIGNYYYTVTYYTSLGETHEFISSVITTTSGNQRVTLTIPISTDPRVIGRKLYRTLVGGQNYQDYNLATIANNTATTYLDQIPDGSLTGTIGMSANRANTTNQFFTVNGAVTGCLDKNLTSIGTGATAAITTGAGTAYGFYAAHGATTAVRFAAFGSNALKALTTGGDNAAFGTNTLQAATTGANNAAFGGYSLFSNISGGSNSALGQFAGYSNTASNCIFLGYSAGRYNTTSSKFYVDAYDRTNTAGDDAGAILAGTMNATPANQTLTVNALLTVTQGIKTIHIKGTTSAPTITAGVGAGTSPTVSVVTNSTDLAGQISVTTGTSPTASGVVVTLTFNTAFTSTAPWVVISPANAAAAALAPSASVYPTSTTSTLILNATGTMTASAGPYLWNYHVIQ
jgi:hypothetical protein